MSGKAVVILLCALSAAPVRAAPAAAPEAAFDRAVRDYKAGRYGEAAAGFLAVHAAEGDASLLYNVARAYARLDDVPRALRYYREYLRDAAAPEDRAAVEAAIRRLEARLAERGLQQLSIRSAPAGAELVLDELPVGTTPWTGEIAPGRHLVRLRLSGHELAERELELEVRRSLDVELELSPERPEPVAARAPPGSAGAGGWARPTAEAETVPAAALGGTPAAGDGQVEPLTWATLGTGGALLGGALGLELLRRDAESAAAAEQTQLAYRARYERMTTFQASSRLLLGLGAAGLSAAGLLLYLDVADSTGGDTASLTPAP